MKFSYMSRYRLKLFRLWEEIFLHFTLLHESVWNFCGEEPHHFLNGPGSGRKSDCGSGGCSTYNQSTEGQSFENIKKLKTMPQNLLFTLTYVR
jgi:hypothetical protein